MSYLKLFERVANHVAAVGVKVEFKRGKPLTISAFEKHEARSTLVIPNSLVRLYFEVGDGMRLRWRGRGDGPFCMFEIPRLSALISNSLDNMNRRIEWDDDCEFPYVDDPQLAKKTALRMQKWLAFYDEGNGDRICLDTAKQDASVVFNKHDWFGGGSGKNGHILAKSLMEFLTSWSEVCFQFPRNLYWPEVFRKRGGVDWSSDQFREPFRLPQL